MKINVIEIIKTLSQDDEVKNTIKKFLDLAILVDKNYQHIEQFESLIRLFKGGLSGYNKKYFPHHNEIVELMAIVCEKTRQNHYIKNKDEFSHPNIYDVQLAIFGKESKIISFKEYYRNSNN